METIKNEENFDAVKMIHDNRDKVSFETQNMTFAELKEYIQIKIKERRLQPVGQ